MKKQPTILRHRTAIRRTALSKPVRQALEDGLITESTSFLDYGCGFGDDLRRLKRKGVSCWGWDPIHRPTGKLDAADVVNLGYVVNVIETPAERSAVLKQAWQACRSMLIVSAQLAVDAKTEKATRFRDGHLTSAQTFQKYYSQSELRDWMQEHLETKAISGAPGVVYAFRDKEVEQSFVASRYRRRAVAPRLRRSDVVYEQHKAMLDALGAFFLERGRLPAEWEFPQAGPLLDELGSIKRAFRVLRTVTTDEVWNQVPDERREDLSVYLALARFGGRPRMSELSPDMQLDVKAFYSNYKRACGAADELLFSLGDQGLLEAELRKSPVGKETPAALYVHISALPSLTPSIRAYEGCARAYLGHVEGTNIVKLHRKEPKVSYLSYPDFDKAPHPALRESMSVHLQTFKVRFRDYSDWDNPYILHRKELFVAEGYPGREKFSRLTRQEEKAGLLGASERIGTKRDWEIHLAGHKTAIRGHSLRRTL